MWSQWHDGTMFDVRLGDSKPMRNGEDHVVNVQIRPTGETDESKWSTVTGFGEYISNNSPIWVKGKVVNGKVKWGSGARSRAAMVKDEAKGWRYFDVDLFGWMKPDEIMGRLNGPPRINQPA